MRGDSVLCCPARVNRPLRPQLATLVPVLALALLTACGGPASDSSGAAGTAAPSRSGGATPTSASSATASSTAASSTSASSTTASSTAGSGTVSLVSCTDQSCTVTLGGTGARAQVMGISIAFTEISSGRATVRAGDRDLSLTEGQSATVGQAQLTCTEVTQDRVTLTVTRA